MSERSYRQYCALARALDVAGDRWTLLIVRELVPGPRRFTDLLDGLPGISRKLLTERLRALERDDVIGRRELPPSAAHLVYELTRDGRGLATAMTPLIAWGARRIGDRRRGESFRARWPAVALAGLADRDAAKGVSETYQYVVGGAAFYFTVEDGSIELHDGRATDATVTWTTDDDTWGDVVAGKTSFSSAVAAGALSVSGDPRAARRLRRIFFHRPRERALARRPAKAGDQP
jgi:DNA-binding HxlR family transcriptional regulator/putative sterol carrier protein